MADLCGRADNIFLLFLFSLVPNSIPESEIFGLPMRGSRRHALLQWTPLGWTVLDQAGDVYPARKFELFLWGREG